MKNEKYYNFFELSEAAKTKAIDCYQIFYSEHDDDIPFPEMDIRDVERNQLKYFDFLAWYFNKNGLPLN